MKFILRDQGLSAVGAGEAHLNEHGLWCGAMNLCDLDPELRRLFAEYETLINDQIFVVADRVASLIDSHKLSILLEDGRTMMATGLFLANDHSVCWTDG